MDDQVELYMTAKEKTLTWENLTSLGEVSWIHTLSIFRVRDNPFLSDKAGVLDTFTMQNAFSAEGTAVEKILAKGGLTIQ